MFKTVLFKIPIKITVFWTEKPILLGGGGGVGHVGKIPVNAFLNPNLN